MNASNKVKYEPTPFVLIEHAEWIQMFEQYQRKWADQHTFTRICLSLDVSVIAVTRALRRGEPFLGPTRLRLALISGRTLDLNLALNCLSEKARSPWIKLIESPCDEATIVNLDGVALHHHFKEFKRLAMESAESRAEARQLVNQVVNLTYYYDPQKGMPSPAAASWMQATNMRPTPEMLFAWQGVLSKDAFARAARWSESYLADPQGHIDSMLSTESCRSQAMTSFRPGQKIIDQLKPRTKTDPSLNISVLAAIENFIKEHGGNWDQVPIKGNTSVRDGSKITLRMPASLYDEIGMISDRKSVNKQDVMYAALMHSLGGRATA